MGRRDELPILQNRVDEVPRLRVLHDGVVLRVVEPMMEFITAGKAVDNRSVRLDQALGIVFQWRAISGNNSKREEGYCSHSEKNHDKPR